jgi:APA family basic amino acid/polyamine antiporter
LFALVGGLATGISFAVILVQNATTRYVGMAWLGLGYFGYIVYRRYYVKASIVETIKAPPMFGPAVALEYRTILAPVVDSEQSREAVHIACRLAAERRSQIVAIRVIVVPLELPLDAPLPDQEELADGLLDEAHDIGELYGVRVIERVERARNAGRAICDEAARRNAEIIVMGAPRLPHRTRRSAIFGKTVDYVLKHAPCRVMVGAGSRAVA